MFTPTRMSDAQQPAQGKPSELPAIDDRLVQWMAVQALQDRYARLAEGGADADARVELASLFIDLPVSAVCRSARVPERELWAMPVLLGGSAALFGDDYTRYGPPRWLLVGGPGSGKSTLTTMVAQALRLPWIEGRVGVLPEQVHDAWQRVREGLARLAEAGSWGASVGALPLRVNLPSLARWLAGRGPGAAVSLWDYLAARLVDDLASVKVSTEVSARELRAMTENAGTIFWILDGLDEVPPSAGRRRVIEVVRATVCDAARGADGVLVATRPQGYEGEFDDLDAAVLTPLPQKVALGYAERLLHAWSGGVASADLASRLEKMRGEFAKPEVVELIQTPLHTTMAALLASRGSLSSARSMLFEHYFITILRRELGKPFDHGIQDVDEGVLRALHARAGLALQVRSQAQTGARSSLRRRELRAMLTAIYTELGVRGDDVRAQVDRIMRFAAERLVLLLHASEGEYEFGVRSLQEFFAAQALVEAEPAVVRARLEVIALDPHWSNVLAFVVSSQALKTAKADREHALMFTVELCHALNAGDVGGEPAARCFMGSRLAISMLQETERYGRPWLHDPLWEVALEAAASPVQDTFVSVARGMGMRHRSGAWNDGVEVHTRLGLLAANWAGTDLSPRRQRVVREAEKLLAQGGDGRLSGWRLLKKLLLDDVPAAISVAEALAPNTREAAQDMFTAIMADYAVPMPRWLDTFADRHLTWFTPGWARPGVDEVEREKALAFKIHRRLRMTGQAILLCWNGVQNSWAGELATIETHVTHWQDIERRLPDVTPTWTMWGRLVRFMAAPSHSSLAEILDAAGHEEAFNELNSVSHLLPWPIQACLAHASAPEELLTLSAGVRAGRFGSVEDWRAAEARWRQSPRMDLDEIGVWLEADGPWNRDIGSRGMIVMPWYSFDLLDSIAAHREAFPWLLQWIDNHSPPPRKSLELLAQFACGNFAIPLRVTRLCEPKPDKQELLLFRNLPGLLPDVTGPDAEGWFTLLDERGRVGGNLPGYIQHDDTLRKARAATITQTLIDRLRERPDQWGLLNAVSSLLHALPDQDLSALLLPDLPNDAPPQAHATRALLTLLSGRTASSNLASLSAQLRVDDSPQGDLRASLADILLNRTGTSATTIPLLLAALDSAPPPKSAVRDALLGALFAHLRRSLTPAFATSDAWHTHDFPEPFLAGLPPPPPPPRLLRIAELTNLRLFKETPLVDTPFPLPTGDKGQWIVLVGENGVGKTTLLRVLALTLAAPSVASKLLDERLPMMRNGSEGRASIELDTGTLSILVHRGERTELVDTASLSDALRPWVVAYGVRRGNARGEKDREPEVGPIGELHTLFDRPASLHNAVQWLKDLDADVLREQRRSPRSPDAPPGPREGVWKSVEHALQALLGITRIEVDESGVHVHHPHFGRVRLDALSDGYLTTAGWIIDMIARWIDRQQELDEPVGANVLHQMCGFVLLDEIDLHLHPMWQMRIIEDVRRLFPRLSFVVTTHNPLTLQGARPGEVYVMRREGARIELVQRDIRPGQDVDRVLFEQFGVEHTFDRETRDLLARHRDMLERGVSPEDPDRKKTEARLRERFGDVSDTLRGERSDAHGGVAPLAPEERALLAPFLKKKS